ncbi:MAG: nucleotidyltransferase domain-containing protein [Thermodesulfobacteriota bacterium]
MLSEKDKRVFSQFASSVQDRFPRARVWAFGSRARGDAALESDLDVCVVVPELDDATDKAITDIAWEVGFENDVIISTVTYSDDEFEKGPCSESPLVREILTTGMPA